MRNLESRTRLERTGIRIDDAVEWACDAIALYDNSEVISSPTTTEATLGNPWRCWESNPGPSVP